MPGFAFIYGLFSCFNQRIIDPTKPKTISFDAEVPIGEDPSGQLQCVNGLVHYFVPQQQTKPDDDRKYLISGKVVSIQSHDEIDSAAYDLEIEALTVCPCIDSLQLFCTYWMVICFLQLFLMPDIDDPPRTMITIAGQVRSSSFFLGWICSLAIMSRARREFPILNFILMSHNISGNKQQS